MNPGADDRTVLTMMSLCPDPSITQAVAQFNRTSMEYKIELKQSFSFDENLSDKAWNDAVTKFNVEVISGNIPDILDLSHLTTEGYFNKGFWRISIPTL